jgi:adenosylcobinamide-GDP ribazoletransferase
MKYIYLGFKFAFSFFSILPVSFKQSDDLSNEKVLKYTLYFFPLVGLVLSGLVVGLYNLLESNYFNAFLCSVTYMFLYGFLHTEAISDVVDAIYAAHSGKDPYEVIKEPQIGAMGMLYSVTFLLLKLVALTYLLKNELFLEFIVLAVFSRLMVLYIIKLNEFRSSFVSMLKNSLKDTRLIFISLVYMSICFYILGLNSFFLIVLSTLISYLIISFLEKKLGFLNGDVLGFNIETIEIISMILIIQINC